MNEGTTTRAALSLPLTALRLTDRRALLRHLAKLGDPDPQRRADAGLAAAELLQRRGVRWDALVPLETAEEPATERWPDVALQLLDRPGLTRDEMLWLRKVSAWRKPGHDGMAKVKAIAERLTQSPSARGLTPGNAKAAETGSNA